MGLDRGARLVQRDRARPRLRRPGVSRQRGADPHPSLRGRPRSDVAAAGQDAIAATGVPVIADHNAPGAVGVGPVPVNEVGGTRLGAASTYLAAARGRPNLTVRGDALVDRVILPRGARRGAAGHGRADPRRPDRARGRRVPQPGDPAAVRDRPGGRAGRGGRRAVAGPARCRPQPCRPPRGLPRPRLRRPAEEVRRFQLVATRTATAPPRPRSPDLQLIVGGPFTDSGEFFVAAALLKPRSRGRVWLRSADPLAAPRIRPRLLHRPRRPAARLADGLRRAWESCGRRSCAVSAGIHRTPPRARRRWSGSSANGSGPITTRSAPARWARAPRPEPWSTRPAGCTV